MTAKEIRLRAKQRLKGKTSRAFLIIFLYSLMLSLANSVPLIGGIAMIVIGPVLAFGIYKSIVLLINGENVGIFDYFKLGFDNFVKIWQLIWEVLKKTWVPLLLILFGFLSSFATVFFGALGMFISSSIGTGGEADLAIVTFVLMGLSLLLIFGGIIWYIIKSLRYTLVNFYLMKNPNLAAKEIMELNNNDIENNVGKVARIMFFYGIISFLISFVATFIIVFIVVFTITMLFSLLSVSGAVTEIFTKLISNVIGGVMGALINAWIMPKLIASYNELHEYITYRNNLVPNTENNIINI